MITALELIDDLSNALNTNNTDKLNVHIKSTDVSSGDASAANQATMITALQVLDNLVTALNSIGTDKLDIHLKTSAVTIGDATSANQTSMITALELIDDLRGALGSVNTDDLQVDIKTAPTLTMQSLGGDKIFAMKELKRYRGTNSNISSGDSSHSGPNVPSGEIWVITGMSLRYSGTPPSRIYGRVAGGGSFHYICMVESVTSGVDYPFTFSNILLDEGDQMQMRVIGGTSGDDIDFRYQGYTMSI